MDGDEAVQTRVDLNVSKLVAAGAALDQAESAFTMHSHAAMREIDDALAGLGDKWTQAQMIKQEQAAAEAAQTAPTPEAAAADRGRPPHVSRQDDPLRDLRAPPRNPLQVPGGGGFGSGFPGNNPYEVGRADLMPGGLGGPAFGGGHGGGMFVGPDHPMFQGRFPGHPHMPRGGGGGGVPDSHIPFGSVPPGARFDPIHGMRPPTGPRPRNPYANPSGPDFDEFMPPGNWNHDY
mgnify:CR=1 FL=1